MTNLHTTKFRKWLQNFLKEREITNVECGLLFGVTEFRIGHYLRGTRTPTYEALQRIKQATGVDMNDLFD